MDRATNINEGMPVYGVGDQMIGKVEKIHGNGFHVNGQHYDRDQVLRVTQKGIYLRGTGETTDRAQTMTDRAEGEMRIPVAEERLSVGKRDVDLGEVDIRKTVTTEEQTVPVSLRRDEVHVEEVDVNDRPLREGEDAFNEGTIRVQLRGEEAVVAKEAFVTGEVVVDKNTVSREEQVSGTVRKQRVDVDKAYQEARGSFEQMHGQTRAAQGRTFEQAETHYRTGFNAAHDERYTDQEFEQAEPHLRSEYEANAANRTGRTGGKGANSGDTWEHLRQEVREGWNKARNR